MSDLPFHPLANIFPLIEGARFNELVASIKANGLRTPIVLHGGRILDGRNRYRACQAAGVDARFEMFNGEDPLAFVIDENLHRRHLDESQRAMIAARLANVRQGERTDLEPSANLPKVSQEKAAAITNVSQRLLRSAKVVQEKAAPELRAAVDQGRIAVSVAEKLVELPAAEQRKTAAAADPAKVARAEMLRHNREERLAQIGRADPLPQEKFRIIYADPPWRFDVFSRETGLEKSPDQHYPTMTMEEICALPISDLVPDYGLLFLWITAPFLSRMDEVFRAWGRIEQVDPEYGVIREPWRYVTNYCWDKVHIAPGYWNRNQHEHLLIAQIGDVPAPLPQDRVPSVYSEARTVHSAKPDYFRRLIDKHFPDWPKIELFARDQHPGWAVWGNQVTAEAA